LGDPKHAGSKKEERMRLLLVFLCVGLAAMAWAETYEVGPSLELKNIFAAMELASAGDTVLVRAGVYDSVRFYDTPLGRRSAIVSMRDGVTLLGIDRDDVRIDQSESEYGVLCVEVGPTTVIDNLTVLGTVGRARVPEEDGDGRALVAGIACVEGASPTITDVTVKGVSTGVVVRSDASSSAPTLSGVEVARCDHHGVYVYNNGPTPVVLDHVTIVGNFDNGIYVYQGEADLSNCNVTHNGKSGIKAYQSEPLVTYCNLFWNDAKSDVPENYSGMDDLTGIDGNVSEEPFYCDYYGNAGYDYHLCFTANLLTMGEGGTPIGAWGGGCTDCVETPVRMTSWGAIKALFR
jgi:hypothetical protein